MVMRRRCSINSPTGIEFPSFYDFPEEIVTGKGDWTCHANSNSVIARCEPYAPPNTGSCARAQKSRDSSRASRLFVSWLFFHTACYLSFAFWTRLLFSPLFLALIGKGLDSRETAS